MHIRLDYWKILLVDVSIVRSAPMYNRAIFSDQGYAEPSRKPCTNSVPEISFLNNVTQCGGNHYKELATWYKGCC